MKNCVMLPLTKRTIIAIKNTVITLCLTIVYNAAEGVWSDANVFWD